jgi:hypothetical protein
MILQWIDELREERAKMEYDIIYKYYRQRERSDDADMKARAHFRQTKGFGSWKDTEDLAKKLLTRWNEKRT